MCYISFVSNCIIHVSSRNGSVLVDLLIKYVKIRVERAQDSTKAAALLAKIQQKINEICTNMKAKGSSACGGTGESQIIIFHLSCNNKTLDDHRLRICTYTFVHILLLINNSFVTVLINSVTVYQPIGMKFAS